MDPIVQKLAAHDELFESIGAVFKNLENRQDELEMQITIAVGELLTQLDEVSPGALSRFVARMEFLDNHFQENPIVTAAIHRLKLSASGN